MRTFVGIELSEEMRGQLGRVTSALALFLSDAGVAGRLVRWSGVDKAHITLRFLGETDAAQRQQIRAGLAEMAPRHAPFVLALADLGCFPNWTRPQVLWTGVAGDRGALECLQAPIEEIAQSAGFPAERRPFSPHITLARTARSASPQDRRRLGAALAAFRADPPLDLGHLGTVTVDHLIFMRSDLRPTGSVYTPIERVEIGRG